MTNFPRLIGITGAAGSGKDTIAAVLCEHFGFTRRGLADPIKELLNKRFGWKPDQWQDRDWKERPALAELCIDSSGEFAGATRYSPRQLAQWLGTEVGRDTFGEDGWINALMKRWSADGCPPTVVPDVRFDNEARAIIREGGVVFSVYRPGIPLVAAHVSEAGVSAHLIEAHFLNAHPLVEFQVSVKAAFERLYVH